MEIQANITLKSIKFDVDEETLLLQMIKNIIGERRTANEVLIDNVNNCLYTIYDASYHGSPDYQKSIFCTDETQVKKFELLKQLLDVVRRQKEVIDRGC